MTGATQIWKALETINGLVATLPEWQTYTQREFQDLRAYLKPLDRLATVLPCGLPGCGCGLGREVITHAPADIVAVCRDEFQRCTSIPVGKPDLVLYRFDIIGLGRALAASMGLEPCDEAVPGHSDTRKIGSYRPLAGFAYPCYLSIQQDADRLLDVVRHLCLSEEGPFLLLVPTERFCLSETLRLLRARRSLLLILSETFTLNTAGALSTTPTFDAVLADFCAKVLPQTSPVSESAFFPTPPDATWEQVRMRFLDGHRVHIRVGNAEGVFNYTQMGMVNRRNGEPTLQWELLRKFAENGGKIDWSTQGAGTKLKKRKELLSKALQAFFRLNGDAFRYRVYPSRWEARFIISEMG